jgi:hypothetical protein
MKRYVATLLVVLGVVGVVGIQAIGAGYAKDENAAAGRTFPLKAQCSEATLHGTYLFAVDGVEIKGNDQVPLAVAGYEVYDGNGKFRAVQSINVGGKVFRHERFAGTYTVKADCTATSTSNGGSAQLDLFVAPDGSKFTAVQIKPKSVVISGFELQGTAKRVGP